MRILAGRRSTGVLLVVGLVSLTAAMVTAVPASANALGVQVTRLADGTAPFADWRAADVTGPTGDPARTQAADDADGDGDDVDPGDDVGALDAVGPRSVGVVRTLDTVRWRIAYSISRGALDDTTAVGVSVTVDLPRGFTAVAASLPAASASSPCPSGTTTATITATMNPDPVMVGGQRVTCRFPSSLSITSAVSRYFDLDATVAGDVANGVGVAGAPEYAPTVSIVDGEGSPTTTRTRADHPSAAVVVSAAPRWDLSVLSSGQFGDPTPVTYQDSQLWFVRSYSVRIRPVVATEPRGTSAVAAFSWRFALEDLTTAAPLGWELTGCAGGGVRCTQGTPGAPVDMSFTPPTWASFVSTFSAVNAPVAIVSVRIPVDRADAQDGVIGNGAGSLQVRAHVGDGLAGTDLFDPTDRAGVSNFGAGVEPRPAAVSTATADGRQNQWDNLARLSPATYATLGKSAADAYPLTTDVSRTGILVNDGQTFFSSLVVAAANNVIPAGTVACDKWDNALATPRGADESRFVARRSPTTIDGVAPYVVEYGRSSSWGRGVADSTSPSAWYAQNTSDCADGTPDDLGGGVRWVGGSDVDWTNRGGGRIDAAALNMVRVRFTAPLPPGVEYAFRLSWVAGTVAEGRWHLNASAVRNALTGSWTTSQPTGCSTVARTCPVPPSGIATQSSGAVDLARLNGTIGATVPGTGTTTSATAVVWQHAGPSLVVDHCSVVAGSPQCSTGATVYPGDVATLRLRATACVGTPTALPGETIVAPYTTSTATAGACLNEAGRWDATLGAVNVPAARSVSGVKLIERLPAGIVPRSASVAWTTVDGNPRWTPSDGCAVGGCVVVWDLGSVAPSGSRVIDLDVRVDPLAPYGTVSAGARATSPGYDQGVFAVQNLTVAPSNSALATMSSAAAVADAGTDARFTLAVRNDSAATFDTVDSVIILPFDGDGRGSVVSGPLPVTGVSAGAAVQANTEVWVSATPPSALDALDAPTVPPTTAVPPGVTYPSPSFSRSDRLVDPRFDRAATTLGGPNWPCRVDWSAATLTLVPVAPATSCPAPAAITALRLVGLDRGGPRDAQRLPTGDGQATTGYLAPGETAAVTISLGTSALDGGDRLVGSFRATFGTAYAEGTAEADALGLPADYTGGASVLIHRGLIGNRVFADLDGNGRRDSGEPGIAGVRLQLLDATGAPAVDLRGRPVADVVTDARGAYAFDRLRAGRYIVRVAAAATAVGGPLEGAVPSPSVGDPATGGDESVDQQLGADWRTGVIDLGIGTAPTGEADPEGLVPATVRDADADLTADLGVVPAATVSVTATNDRAAIHPGDGLVRTFEVRATGTAVRDVALSDGDAVCRATLHGPTGDTDGDGVLDVGETWRYGCAVAAVTDDLDGRADSRHRSEVTVTARDVAGRAVTDTDTTDVDLVEAALAVSVTTDRSAVHEGDAVTARFEVVATGDPVDHVTVIPADTTCAGSLRGPSGDDGDDVLEPGETWAYRCRLDPVTDGLDGRTDSRHELAVTARATDSLGTAVTSGASTTVDLVRSSVTVLAGASRTAVHDGDLVTYAFRITGSGDPVAAIALSVDDPACAATLSAPTGDDGDGLLSDGESWTATCVVARAADADDGTTDGRRVVTATVAGTDPAGAAVTDRDTVSVAVVAATIAVTATVDRPAVHDGDTVTATYAVTVTGDAVDHVTLVPADAGCADTVAGPTGDDGDGLLEAGETWTYRCDRAVGAADGRDVILSATASGIDAAGGTTAATASTGTTVVSSRLRLTATPDATAAHRGDVVAATLALRVTGDPVDHVTLDDLPDECRATLAGPTGDDGDGLLELGETWTWRCDLPALDTAADAADGTTDGTATWAAGARATDPAGASVTAAAAVAVDIVGAALVVGVSASTPSAHEGDTVTYRIEVAARDGEVTDLVLGGLDPGCRATLSGPTGAGATGSGGSGAGPVLRPGVTWTYECSVVVTDGLDGSLLGDHTVTVTADGTDALGAPVTATDAVTVDLAGVELDVVKRATPTAGHAGERVDYRIEVTARGPVRDVVLDDTDDDCDATLAGPTGDDGDAVLEAGETWAYTCHVTLAADPGTPGPGTAGTHTAAVTVRGHDAGGVERHATDGVRVDVVGSALTVTASALETIIRSGDDVTLTFAVTSTGDPVSRVALDPADAGCADTLTGPVRTGGDGDDVLEAGETWTYRCRVVGVTDRLDGRADGGHTAGVTATGRDPLGTEVAADDDVRVDVVAATITIRSTVSTPAVAPGDPVVFTLTVTSTGPVADLVVRQPGCDPTYVGGDDDGDGVLDPAEHWSYTCVVAATTAGATDDGRLVGEATATGTDALGGTVEASGRAEVVLLGAVGDRVWSDADGDGRQDDGEPGLGGVTVQLQSCAPADPTSCATIATTTTGADGRYRFDRVPAGSVRVRVLAPDGFTPTVAGAAGATSANGVAANGVASVAAQATGPLGDGGDSDVDAAGVSLVFTLAPGEVTDRVDAGFVGAHDLAIHKAVVGGLESVPGGHRITWSIDVTNAGPGDARGTVRVTDQLPDGVDDVAATAPEGWTCTRSDRTLTCLTDGLAVGATASLRVSGRVATPAGGAITVRNTATVAGPSGDASSIDDTSSAEIRVPGAGGAVPTASGAPTPTTSPGSLAFTGVSTWILLMLGGACLVTGAAARTLAGSGGGVRRRLRPGGGRGPR